jgi:hypothetical protein
MLVSATTMPHNIEGGCRFCQFARRFSKCCYFSAWTINRSLGSDKGSNYTGVPYWLTLLAGEQLWQSESPRFTEKKLLKRKNFER